MPTTFLDLCVQLVEDAGISGEFTSVSNQTGEFQRVVNWIIRATTEVEGKWFDWDFLHNFHSFDTIVDVSDYPAPSDHNLWDNLTAKIPAEQMELSYLMWTRKKRDPTTQISGDPYMYTVLPDKAIRLYDTPTTVKTIEIEYWSIPTVLEENSDQPSIPVQFRDVIVGTALRYYANYESADESKIQALENFDARMVQLQSREAPSWQAKDSRTTGADIVVRTDSSGYGYADSAGDGYGDGYIY